MKLIKFIGEMIMNLIATGGILYFMSQCKTITFGDFVVVLIAVNVFRLIEYFWVNFS